MGIYSTPNCLTFVKTTGIAYHQNPEAPVDFLPICNSSRFYKRQAIRSRSEATNCEWGEPNHVLSGTGKVWCGLLLFLEEYEGMEEGKN